MYHDLLRINLLIRFGYLLIPPSLLPFIGKILFLLYTTITYLQENNPVCKVHNKKRTNTIVRFLSC